MLAPAMFQGTPNLGTTDDLEVPMSHRDYTDFTDFLRGGIFCRLICHLRNPDKSGHRKASSAKSAVSFAFDDGDFLVGEAVKFIDQFINLGIRRVNLPLNHRPLLLALRLRNLLMQSQHLPLFYHGIRRSEHSGGV